MSVFLTEAIIRDIDVQPTPIDAGQSAFWIAGGVPIRNPIGDPDGFHQCCC